MAKCWQLLFFLAFLLPASATSCHPDDLRALRDFTGNLRGERVLLHAAWSGTSCCDWEGVGCDGASGRVTTLWLPSRGLACHITGASSAGLMQLESLNLANNRLLPKSLQIWLRGFSNAGRSLGNVFTNMQLHVKCKQITLDDQHNTITGSNNTVRSGSNNIVSGNDNTVISGNNNVVSGSHNTVTIGDNNVVSGSNHVVSGNHNVVTENKNTVFGNHNMVSGIHNTVSGSHSTVSGSHNTVSGSHHSVSGSNNIVSGSNNTVSGRNHVVYGSNKVVSGG